MPVTIGGSGPITGVTSINTTVSDTELGYLDGVTSAIQTQINANLPGMQLVAAQSFSAATVISFNNCFTSTYENYRIVIAAGGSTDGSGGVATRLRLRSGGTDYTASNYAEFGIYVWAAGGPSRYFNNSVTAATVGWHYNYSGVTTLDIASPAASGLYKHFTSSSLGTGTADGYGGYASGRMITTASYDGFSIFPTSGTLTGTIRCYGYRNS